MQQSIDPVMLALSLGATFVARSFSGDKDQLVPILKAGMAHRGFALVDVVSPCVTFNDHDGSTKSYLYTREHQQAAIEMSFVPHREEIVAEYQAGTTREVAMHDGSVVRFSKVPDGYDPTDRRMVMDWLAEHQRSGAVPTGLLFLDPDANPEMHAAAKTPERPLTELPYDSLCPGAAALEALQRGYR
jgi:2-oxoglutarate ferredoxin oxidoreductase subunit beta